MLVHVKTLSLWEIAHYWHDFDPRLSTSSSLPLPVRNTLLVLAEWCGHSVSYRVSKDHAFRLELAKDFSRVTARRYRRTFRRAIETRVFRRTFFEGMAIGRSHLARLCIQHNEPLPKFWFPDNEKYPFTLDGDITDEVTDNGRYALALIYDDTPAPAATDQDSPPEPITLKSHAVRAAHASHAPVNAIKDRFILYFEQEGHQFPSRRAAARSFHASLDEKSEKLLFANEDAALRTLLDALRVHLKASE